MKWAFLLDLKINFQFKNNLFMGWFFLVLIHEINGYIYPYVNSYVLTMNFDQVFTSQSDFPFKLFF